jgi:hypothetical protein
VYLLLKKCLLKLWLWILKSSGTFHRPSQKNGVAPYVSKIDIVLRNEIGRNP